MSEKKISSGIVIGLIIIITLLHYTTGSVGWPLHDFYRRLYYLPIIIAAFRFRMKGGFFASLAVVLLYSPHMLFYFGRINLEVLNQLFEAGMFVVVGMITGILVEGDYRKRMLLEMKISELADMENYTHNVLDSIDSGILSIDSNNKITTINKKAINLFETSENAMNFLGNAELQLMAEEVLKGKRMSYSREYMYNTGEKVVDLFVLLHPLRNIDGIIEGAVVVIRDITGLKQLQEQLRRSEGLSAIGQMASSVAHEIRNPLGIIKTISQTIGRDIKDTELKEGLTIINDEINRANKVIKELLDFAKPYSYMIERLSIRELLSEVVNIVSRSQDRNLYHISLTAPEDYCIEGDIDKLKQAFLNIILNGLQAMKNGGNLSIALSSDANGLAAIDFKDDGEGISKEIQKKIFDPFYTTKAAGTGLGLSITYRIVEEHRGRIEIESEVNQGTTIKVLLPICIEA